jgi:lipopolysaccharide export system protein LptA
MRLFRVHKKALVTWFILLFAVVGALAFYFTHVGEGERLSYEVLKRGIGASLPKEGVSSQSKEDIRRDLYQKPLHARLMGESSRFFLDRKEGKEEVAEAITKVALFAQESIDAEGQWVRVVLAKEATYFIKEDRLVAKDVTFFRFRLPGQSLPETFPSEKPAIEGEAAWAELFVKDHKIDLNASKVILKEGEKGASIAADSLLFDGLFALFTGNVLLEHPMGKATAESGEVLFDKQGAPQGIKEAVLIGDVHFYRPDGSFLTCDTAAFSGKEQTVFCSGPAALTRIEPDKEGSHTLLAPGGIFVDPAAKRTLFLRSPDSQIHFIDAFGEIYADAGELDYEGKALKQMKMEGKVFMAHAPPGKEDRSYAYADKVTYDPETKEMVMEGDRVLIYDRVNKMEVSAPRLRVRRDQETQKDRIKGEGDVRFTLDEKEFEMLKQRFKW